MTGADDWRNWALVSALGLIWGGSFTITGYALAHLEPISLVAARLLVGAAILVPLAYLVADGLPPRSGAVGRRLWRQALIGAACANAFPFMLLTWAQTHISSGLAGVFMAGLPLIVLPLAHVFVPGERMTTAKAAGFLIGSSGLVALIGWDALSQIGGGGVVLLAQAACILAASGYAVGSVASKIAPPCHPVSFGAATLLLAAAMATPIALLAEDPLAQGWAAGSAAAVVWLGAAPTALAMFLLLTVLRRAGPTFLTMVNYQVPLWAVALGVVFLGEKVPPEAPTALALILGGVAVSQGAAGAVWRAARPRRAPRDDDPSPPRA